MRVSFECFEPTSGSGLGQAYLVRRLNERAENRMPFVTLRGTARENLRRFIRAWLDANKVFVASFNNVRSYLSLFIARSAQ